MYIAIFDPKIFFFPFSSVFGHQNRLDAEPDPDSHPVFETNADPQHCTAPYRVYFTN
jgi:hypothetical protein